MVTKMLYDNLTNFAGYGVEDPRADRIIPWALSKKSDKAVKEIKWDGNWRRSLGVDMTSDACPNFREALSEQAIANQDGGLIQKNLQGLVTPFMLSVPAHPKDMPRLPIFSIEETINMIILRSLDLFTHECLHLPT